MENGSSWWMFWREIFITEHLKYTEAIQRNSKRIHEDKRKAQNNLKVEKGVSICSQRESDSIYVLHIGVFENINTVKYRDILFNDTWIDLKCCQGNI